MRLRRRTLMAGLPAALLATGCTEEGSILAGGWCPHPKGTSYGSALSRALPQETVVLSDLSNPLEPRSLVVSADGAHVAALHGFQVLIWDALAGGEPTERLSHVEHPLGPRTLAASADFARFYFPGKRNTLAIVDRASGERRDVKVTVRSENDYVQEATLAPDGETVAILNRSGDVTLYSVSQDKEVGGFAACVDSPRNIRFSPDSSRLVVCSFGPRAQVWDVAEKERITTIERESWELDQASWSPDGSKLAFTVSAFNSEASWNIDIVDTSTWDSIDVWPQYSPGWVEYASDEELWVRERGTEFLVIMPDASSIPYPTEVPGPIVKPSPDGKIGYVADTKELGGFNIETREPIRFKVPAFECAEMDDPDRFDECR